MVKFHTGDCSKCWRSEVRITYRWKRSNQLCVFCDRERVLERRRYEAALRPVKAKKPISKKPSESLKEKRERDWEVGRKIWSSRAHVCVECGLPIQGALKKIYLSHLLSKGAHPELRFDPENIVLHHAHCHNKWEFSPNRAETVTYKTHAAYIQSHSMK